MAKSVWRSLSKKHRSAPDDKRLVHVNNQDANTELDFASNHIATTKYTWYTFLPKGLFEQFRRVANFYFLFHAVISITPISPVNPVTTIGPLVFVVGLAMLKELFEDIQRGRSDREINGRLVDVVQRDGSVVATTWTDVQVGDILCVHGDSEFPADLLCLGTTDPEGTCYVETMNLDGETNLKIRRAVAETFSGTPGGLKDIRGVVECEQPNISIYTFVGNLILEGEREGGGGGGGANLQPISLNPQQFLLRGSILRNTKSAYGLVIFTGRDTKIMMNAIDPPSKRSTIERRLDYLVFFQLFLLLLMSLATAIVFAVKLKREFPDQLYLMPWDIHEKSSIGTAQFNPDHPAMAGLLEFFTSLVLYGEFVSALSLFGLHVVKLIQARFINADLAMYYADKDIPCRARTSNLNEELGMMEFFKCSIAGVSYGTGVTEVEKSAAYRAGNPVPLEEEQEVYVPEKPLEKGFNMRDPRLDAMRWLQEPTAGTIRRFLEVLAVCHTVVTSGGDTPDTVVYQAESPDESAFVSTVFVREYAPGERVKAELKYELLNTLEFSSARKRMSVVVRAPGGELLLLCKGADSVILERLDAAHPEATCHVAATQQHMKVYAEAGLRTLAIAFKPLDEAFYRDWQVKWVSAKQEVSSAEKQAQRLEELAEDLERGLFLLGATAIEDKLQVGVAPAIDNLARAGIKLWVLTGDKQETAINIGYACSLLRLNMVQHVIQLEDNQEAAAQAVAAGRDVDEFFMELVKSQIASSQAEVEADGWQFRGVPHALVIDGKALAHALRDDDARRRFLQLALRCESVICCRVSPKQKAQVTELVRVGGKQICLSVGDGANDVGMIQKANIGAVMAADFSIGQFRFLERLVLVHGCWSYKRLTRLINYFFYKNFVFGFTVFFYNCTAQMSGSSVYWDWFLSLYNVVFTSIPIGVVACIDQDVKAVLHVRFPGLYRQSQKNTYFKKSIIALWLLDGLYQSLAIYYMTMAAYWRGADRESGKVLDHNQIGTTMFTSIVIVANLHLGLYWTWMHHAAIWGSIFVFFLFCLVAGEFPVSISRNAYHLLREVAASPTYYLTVLLCVVASLLPTYAFRSLYRCACALPPKCHPALPYPPPHAPCPSKCHLALSYLTPHAPPPTKESSGSLLSPQSASLSLQTNRLGASAWRASTGAHLQPPPRKKGAPALIAGWPLRGLALLLKRAYSVIRAEEQWSSSCSLRELHVRDASFRFSSKRANLRPEDHHIIQEVSRNEWRRRRSEPVVNGSGGTHSGSVQLALNGRDVEQPLPELRVRPVAGLHVAGGSEREQERERGGAKPESGASDS
eukprot:jgi/Mesen1/1875/ME000143S00926